MIARLHCKAVGNASEIFTALATTIFVSIYGQETALSSAPRHN